LEKDATENTRFSAPNRERGIEDRTERENVSRGIPQNRDDYLDDEEEIKRILELSKQLQ